ncbi:MAG: hypothetical protein WB797_15910, partial [Nocardioides sp.]
TSPGSTGSSPTSASTEATAMKQFVSHYLATVTADDHATFRMLTPAFRGESGGFDGYNRFWSTIASATPSNMRADARALTVSYDVAYVKTSGAHRTDHRTLHLVKSGSSYLIDGDT